MTTDSRALLPMKMADARVWSHLQRDWLRALLLVVVALVIHTPALSGERIWDDDYLAHDNPFIKSPLFVFEVFRHHLFLDSLSAHYRPVQNISFMVDYFFWNDDTYGYHLTNIGLHALSGVLLYFLARRLLRSLFAVKITVSVCADAAFFLALLWVAHPVHSAAVDYISGRADSLAFVFAAGAWLLYLRAAETEASWLKVTLFGGAASAALLAFCSRETAGLWLIVFLLHRLFFSRTESRKSKALLAVSCVALFSLYCGLRELPERRAGDGPKPGWSGPVRTVLMLRALGDYGRLMVFPTHLHMERTVVEGSNYDSHRSWQQTVSTEYLSIVGLAVAGLLTAGGLRKGPGQAARIFGASWFVVGFLPVSNLFDLNATVAEHWLYLPSVGLLIFAAGLALECPQRFRRLLAVGSGLAVLGLSLQSASRSSDWTTPEHFYQRTIAAGGTSMRVSLNLGQLYAQRGEYARAETCFREILAVYPNYPVAQTNLANALFHEGKKKEAEALFAGSAQSAPQSRKDFPRTWIAALNLAGMREQEHDLTSALTILEKARAAYPSTWEIVSFEAEVLRKSRGPAAALPLVEDFHRANWWNYPAALALGRLRAQNGEIAPAAAALREASRLDVHEVEALNLLAELRVHQNRLGEACAEQRRAVARQPNLPREYLYLSRILEKMGRTAEAKEAIANVTRLQLAVQSYGALAVD
ncbi:MAG: tetratricopeptide repeat protein [Chthoniobacterales bacterium]